MEKCPSYPAVNELASRIAKVETYKSKKDPKRPEESIGNIRETLGILADIAVKDRPAFAALLKYGQERAKIREQNKKVAKKSEEGKG